MKLERKGEKKNMDMIIQIILFPFVCPIYLYMIYLEKQHEKEKKERMEKTENPKYGIYYEHFPSLNELRTGKRKD